MPRVDISPHGIGSLIIKLNNEYVSKYGSKIFNIDGSINHTFISLGDLGLVDNSKTFSNTNNSARDFQFADNGNLLYVSDEAGDTIQKHTLSTAYDITTATLSQSLDISTDGSYYYFSVVDSGSKIFALAKDTFSGELLIQYNLSTAHDLTTATVAHEETTGDTFTHQLMVLSKDGDRIYAFTNESGDYDVYDMGTAFDLSTVSFTESLTYPVSIKGGEFNEAGDKFYVGMDATTGIAESIGIIEVETVGELSVNDVLQHDMVTDGIGFGPHAVDFPRDHAERRSNRIAILFDTDPTTQATEDIREAGLVSVF